MLQFLQIGEDKMNKSFRIDGVDDRWVVRIYSGMTIVETRVATTLDEVSRIVEAWPYID